MKFRGCSTRIAQSRFKLFAGLGAGAFVVVQRRTRAQQHVLAIDTTTGHLVDRWGVVVAIGGVCPTGATLVGPLSQKTCVAHRSRVYLGLMGGSKAREQIGIVPFSIETNDGKRIEIESAHVKFVFPALSLPPGSDERCVQFAIAHAVASGDRRDARYEEVLVMEGMKIAVAGRLERRNDVVRLVGDETRPIIIGVPF
jgi:hypothetical protein